MTVAIGARSSRTNATGPSTSSQPDGPPVQTESGEAPPTSVGGVLQDSVEPANIPRERGSASPPGTTSVPSSLLRTDQCSELHSKATPTNQPTTGMTMPPTGSRISAATSRHPGRGWDDSRLSAGRWPASAAMAAGSPSRSSIVRVSASPAWSPSSARAVAMCSLTCCSNSSRRAAGRSRRAASSRARYSATSWSATVAFIVVSSRIEEVVDGIAEARPFPCEGVERLPAARGQVVIAAWWAAGRLAPGGRDQPVAAQATEQRIDGALAGHHSLDLAEPTDQVEAVAFAAIEQRQHAVFEGSSPQLGEQGHPRTLYHAVHGTR